MAIKYKLPKTIEIPYNEIRLKEECVGDKHYYHAAFYNKGIWVGTMEGVPVEFAKGQSLILSGISGSFEMTIPGD